MDSLLFSLFGNIGYHSLQLGIFMLLAITSTLGLRFANQIAESHVYKTWKKNSNLIESVAILTITTGQLASKLTNREPTLLPKITYIVYECIGVVMLPGSIEILSKTWEDWKTINSWTGRASITAKLFSQGIGILGTGVHVTGTVFRVFGYSEATQTLFNKFKILSMIALGVQIATYISNITLMDDLRYASKLIKDIQSTNQEILSVDFCKLVKEKNGEMHSELATRIKRLLNEELKIFKESIEEPSEKHYEAILASLKEKKKQIQIQLAFIPICYAAQWISTAHKETTKDFAARWITSALWTGETLRHKIFLDNLEELIQVKSFSRF